jgi:RNA polymerase sigma factor (sigma-70 family)
LLIEGDQLNPDLTPPNPENELYEEWKVGQDKQVVEGDLRSVLRLHASKICWMILHEYRPDLVEDVVNDAILGLPTFEGRSSFSTWFHSCALHRFRDESRRRAKRKEVQSDFVDDPAFVVNPSLESDISVRRMLDNLPEFEKSLVQLKVFEGFSDAEVAQKLERTREWIQISWTKLRRKLKKRYGHRKIG